MRRNLAYSAGAALATSAARDFYRTAKRSLMSKHSVHTSKGKQYQNKFYHKSNGAQNVLYSLKYASNSNDTITIDFPNKIQGQEATRIAQGDAINQRQRQILWAKQCQFNLWLQNNTTVPMYYRWFVVQWKFITPGSDPIVDAGTDMFRGQAGNVRNVNFTAISNQQHKHTYPLNPDKFRVFAEGCGTIAGTGSTTYLSESHNSYVSIKRKVSLNKRIGYEDSTNSSCNNPICLLYFVQAVNDFSGGPSGINTDMSHNANIALHFND